MNFDINTLRDIVVTLVPMILSLTVHEFAHAWAAYRLGDDTAAMEGRMTLNPIPHIDIFGTLVIPIFSVVGGGIGLIGWAKPVPISPHRFRRGVTMRKGMMITALAGPASNLIVALVVGGLAMLLYAPLIDTLVTMGSGTRMTALLSLGSAHLYPDSAQALAGLGFGKGDGMIALLLSRMFIMNVGLAVFNMIPMYPLDGSRMLPLSVQAKMAPYSMIVFVGFILIINFAGFLLWVPISTIAGLMLGFWSLLF